MLITCQVLCTATLSGPLLKKIEVGGGFHYFSCLELCEDCEDSTGLFLLSAKLQARWEHPALGLLLTPLSLEYLWGALLAGVCPGGATCPDLKLAVHRCLNSVQKGLTCIRKKVLGLFYQHVLEII